MAQRQYARLASLGDRKYPNQIANCADHHHDLVQFAHQLMPDEVADQDGHADTQEENRIDDAVYDDVAAESERISRQEKKNEQKKNHQAEYHAAFDRRTPEQQPEPFIAP